MKLSKYIVKDDGLKLFKYFPIIIIEGTSSKCRRTARVRFSTSGVSRQIWFANEIKLYIANLLVLFWTYLCFKWSCIQWVPILRTERLPLDLNTSTLDSVALFDSFSFREDNCDIWSDDVDWGYNADNEVLRFWTC